MQVRESEKERPGSAKDQLAAGDFDDLRGFIERVDELGELKTVEEEVDWNLELGGIAELMTYRAAGPALLFDNIKGYPRGYRVFTNMLGTLRRAALVLRLPSGMTAREMTRAWKERIGSQSLTPPVSVASGPVMENVLKGEAIDTFRFPVPKWHSYENGRYIGTGDLVITKDPDSDWVNIGTYRVMVHSRDTLGIWVSPGKHGRIILQKYWDRGENAPVAVSVGNDPTHLALSIMGAPYGVSEYDFVGIMSGRPAEVVRAPHTGLPIPARAEIVLEGEIPPPEKESLPEGPFGEWTGYYASGMHNAPVIKVKTVMHRNDPIITGACDTRPYAPGSAMGCVAPITRCGYLWDQVEKVGVPGIKGVWWLMNRWISVISLKQMYAGHAKRAAAALLATSDAGYHGRLIITVDEDIDPTNLSEVIWAVTSRCDPATGMDILRECWSTPLDPTISPANRAQKNWSSSRAIINACRPFPWKDEFPKTSSIAPEYAEELLKKWSALFHQEAAQ